MATHGILMRNLRHYDILWILLVAAMLNLSFLPFSSAQLCTVRNGATHLTADVQTQPNSDSSTVSVFLNNIIGSPDEIDLSVMKDGPFSDWFIVNGKQLLLTRSLTQQHQLPEHITLRLKCTRRRLIPTIPLTPVGTTIYQANPREFGRTGYTYSIVNDDVREFFVVTDPLQGWIAVRRPLDFERQQEYNIKIRASDGVNTDDFVVTVRIQDSNDLDPAFEYSGCQRISNVCINPRYTATCVLRQAGGALKITPEPVRAFDRDTLRYPIRYSFLPEGQPPTFATYFRINPETAEIRQIRPIDQLDVKEFVIYVKAEEVPPSGGLSRSSVAQLVINVRNQNAHRPVMRVPSTICYVPENAPVGFRATISSTSQTPFQLSAYDADLSGQPGRFTYTIGGVYSNYFQVTPEGFIQCIRPGFAAQVVNGDSIKITITCSEQDTSEVLTSDPMDITIIISKVNDHPPKLQQYNPLELKAGPPDGNPVVTISAIDEDQGKHGQITYSIVYVQRLTVSTDNPSPPDPRTVFAINVDTGVIQQRATVYKGEAYEIKVRAQDTGGKFDEVIIRIRIIDDGRNEAPFFVNPSYVASIPEGVPLQYPVIVVTARDPDNERLLYSIVGGNEDGRFNIDANTGGIFTMAAIDFEQQQKYALIVQAKDPHNAIATTTVSILINDINDHDPEFVGPRPYIFNVPENQAPLRVGVVSATDKDSGPNGDITYSIPPNPYFRIGEKTGEITLIAPLDFERQQQHTLIVTARDNGISYVSDRGVSIPQSRSATAVVTINVIDSEDEDPTFIDRIYYAEVFENRPPGLEVVRVSATDPDTVKRVTYTIVQGDTTAFAINPETGVITTKIPLDYEKTNRYQLIVGTLENKKNSPSSSATVYINVLNENDVGPRFVGGPYVTSIARQTPQNTVIQTILARDGDTGNRITYAIEGDAKGQRFFAVDPSTGEIRIAGDLSQDTDVVYNLVVTARDSGNPPQTATSTVIVNVVSPGEQGPAQLIKPEQPPIQFALPQYQVKIREGANTNSLVEELRIINKPASVIPNLRCEIVSGNAEGSFSAAPTLNQDCEIRTAAANIDFETKSEYDLVVQATGTTETEPNFRISTRVAVSVINTNDNSPQFIFPYPGLTGGRYFGAIDANSNVGTPVLKVSATDADKGDFGLVRYTLVPSVPAQRFEINDESGLVSSRLTFIDSTPDMEPYEFTVQARDSPGQAAFKAAAASVIVNLIRDQNRFILVIEGSNAAKTRDTYANGIVRTIQEKTGKVIGVEKITQRDILDGNRTRPDFDSTDMWMYAIDPDTKRIMTFLDLQSILLAKEVQERRLSEVQTILTGTDRAVEFRAPYILPGFVQPLVYKTWSVWGFEAGLIALAALIILFCIIAMIILCYLWARYREYLKRSRYQPRLEPVMFEPVPPEYETQVLAMNVNEDDNADLGEVNVGFSPRAGIDSVTYIKNQQDRERQMRESREQASNFRTTSNAAFQNANPIYDNPDNAGLEATARMTSNNYAASTRRYTSNAATTGQRVASGTEGINLSLSAEDDDEERLMARSTLTSDQSRVVSNRALRDDYEAPRSYSYSYAYSREFAANKNAAASHL